MYELDPLIKLSLKQLSDVKRVILVGGGKGGVGKSVVTAGIALLLSEKFKVGVLDLDLHGPVVPVLFTHKYEEEVKGNREGIKPIKLGNLSIMSVGLILKESPLPLSGRDKADAVLEFLAHVHWGPLDFLIADLPPGIGDEVLIPLRVIKKLKHGFIVVTKPSGLALPVTQRFIEVLRKEQVRILGIVENMHDPYTSGMYENRLRELLNKYNLTLLGRVPYDPRLESLLLSKKDILASEKLAQAFKEITSKILSSFN